jgi:hypothetical protein
MSYFAFTSNKGRYMTNTTTSIFNSFVHQPTGCQAKALFLIEEFLEKPQSCEVFVLRGSAGTEL